ncbi:cyclopropane-fatty-acyl-phospholipid synthase family protein [Crenobacter sp. SG2305]|uniref:SAM-dependent methyltransferase n=1 Tax=Crenobacter oryzisoli TaxID=3056844 RepID=UPI0025AAAD54|nr:cyclopropane-fatty-acyl-phospholipid synthase family protein [Crenobacter sp. SG2305]MDN0082837.1 cyclopropane-fatty-acyl-phospholipid synthase family protein [Crenobacter sp. SG2305]
MTSTHTLVRPTGAAPAAARVFLRLLGRLRHGHLRLIAPDGSRLLFGDLHHPVRAELQLYDWRACTAILRGGDIGFAEAWRDGWLDTPDLVALLSLVLQNEAAMGRALHGGVLAGVWYWLRHWLRTNSRAGSRRNIHAHYDLGNDFYRLWLDESWSYSCAWFGGDFGQSLTVAQRSKNQRIIEVLGLQPGMRVLEIGCGWGGFAEQACRQGIAVHGVTLSPSQMAFASRRLAGQSLATLTLCDYRDLHGEYDAIVSVEMFEAVGERYWPGYFKTLRRCLRPGGQALVQSITIDEVLFEHYRRGSDFIQQFIFPGGMLPSRERFQSAAARQGLVLSDRADFGADYAETLRRWRAAFEAQREAVRALGFDEAFIRTWLLYLCYCEVGFDAGRTGVSQFLLRKE